MRRADRTFASTATPSMSFVSELARKPKHYGVDPATGRGAYRGARCASR